MHCPVCAGEILLGEEVQVIPAPMLLLLGPKSGQPGLYPNPQWSQDDRYEVHYPRCCIGFFSPDENPFIFDQITENMRHDLEAEIREELEERYQAMFDDVIMKVNEGKKEFCQECWAELEECEEEPGPDNPGPLLDRMARDRY